MGKQCQGPGEGRRGDPGRALLLLGAGHGTVSVAEGGGSLLNDLPDLGLPGSSMAGDASFNKAF